LVAPGGAIVITDPGRAVCEDFIKMCQEDEDVTTTCHEIPFVKTSTTTVPRLLIVVLTRAVDEGDAPNECVAAVNTFVEYLRAHRANVEAPASEVLTTLF